ncbi:amidohydrolase [Rubricoccus marinus]|uniref:Amidohydrolase n=2 Tax=Rubricoccus marinus TaxID=716817 RepID=A0A259TY56_9BACT|nr:amidohydrolase [Rubricoccus marinus]
MRLIALAFLVLASGLASGAAAQDPSYRYETGTYAITNARIQTVTNGVIERGTVVIRDGEIEAVGSGVQAPADATVLDASGLTVYPGMIDGGTSIGLTEINSVEVTVDNNEIGDIVPQVKALTAVNPSSTHIPVTRVGGVTHAVVKPSGGAMPGTAALVHLVGYSPAQMDAGFEAVVVNFPRSGRRGRFDRRTDEAIKKANEKAVETIDEFWAEAVRYAAIDSARTASGAREPLPYAPEAAALLPVLRGVTPLMVEANSAADITAALKWIEEKGVRAVLTGAAEGWRVADEIAASGVPVITGPSTGLPTRASDRYSRAYENAGLMHAAGVTVALRSDESENVRNLPFQAGFAAAYGMQHGYTAQDALESVTIIPARIMGLDSQIGSIEVGKRASLFVATGDPFEPATQITHLFIEGVRVPIDSRHIRLYDEYLDREPALSLPGEPR